MDVERIRTSLAAQVVSALSQRAAEHSGQDGEANARLSAHVRERAEKLFQVWRQIVKAARDESAAARSYSRFDREKAAGKPLLLLATDEELRHQSPEEQRFVAPTSMRDVEETVHLWVQRGRSLGSKT